MEQSTSVDWSAAKGKLALGDEDQQIVEMLAGGKTQAEIAQALGQHRSRIWRKVRRLRARLSE